MFTNGNIRWRIICGIFGLLPVLQCSPVGKLSIGEMEIEGSRQCTKFDFNSTLNITNNGKIVAIYNSALCERCGLKLLTFKALQLRFEIAEYNDILFIMLTTELSGTKEFAQLQSRAGDILVLSLQDIDNEFFVAGSVYIFDKCSRLTYELFPPWSEVQYQLVKAAILSTLHDDLCGKCFEKTEDEEDLLLTDMDAAKPTEMECCAPEIENNQTEINSDYDDDLYNVQVQSNDSDIVINTRVIMPLLHVHRLANGSFIKYNYIVFDSNDPANSTDGHKHLESDETEILYDVDVANTIATNSSSLPEYLQNSEGVRYKVFTSEVADNNTDKLNYEYIEVKEFSNVRITHQSLRLRPQPNITQALNSSLAAKLQKWLSYRLMSPITNF